MASKRRNMFYQKNGGNRLKMASKRRNTFHQNNKQETTEIETPHDNECQEEPALTIDDQEEVLTGRVDVCQEKLVEQAWHWPTILCLVLVLVLAYAGWRTVPQLLCPALDCRRGHQTFVRRTANALAANIVSIYNDIKKYWDRPE
ncbi:hypothetical protein AAG570_010417 [Ranatra chinensis]|uniref:Uncharacterized protein n=1 Tax=Ranatra chinensis TaxID=642074 RepID=A0ABD0YYJ0_9HEMI